MYPSAGGMVASTWQATHCSRNHATWPSLLITFKATHYNMSRGMVEKQNSSELNPVSGLCGPPTSCTGVLLQQRINECGEKPDFKLTRQLAWTNKNCVAIHWWNCYQYSEHLKFSVVFPNLLRQIPTTASTYKFTIRCSLTIPSQEDTQIRNWKRI